MGAYRTGGVACRDVALYKAKAPAKPRNHVHAECCS